MNVEKIKGIWWQNACNFLLGLDCYKPLGCDSNA